jgi:O-antigen/teichoic acid export membrane protein
MSTSEALADTPRGLRAPGTTAMIAGSLVGAVAAYLFQVVGGRSLGPTAFAPIGVLWTVLFLVVTVVLVPLEQFFTREASRGRQVFKEDRKAAAVVIGLAALATGLFVTLTRDALFTGRWIYVFQAVVAVGLFGFMQMGKGLLAAHREFALYGGVLAGEGLTRLGLAFVFLAASATAPSLAWAMVLCPLAVLLFRPWRFDAHQQDVARTPPAWFLGPYVLGSAASQLLLAGAPLGVAARGGSPALFSVVFITFTLFRAPLTLIYSLQGRILPLLVKMAHESDHAGLTRMARKVLAGGALLTVIGGALGWLIGPQIVEILFGPGFRPSAVVAGLAAAGVMAGSTAQVAGQVLVAEGSTVALAGAWIAGLVTGLVVMAGIPGEPDRAVAIGFVTGELVAAGVVAWRLLGSGRKAQAGVLGAQAGG